MFNNSRDLTRGNITGGLWAFAVPLMLGNVLQQFYNLADTWVVGKYIGDNALAAVGSSYTLMTFLTSVVAGLSLGTGSFVSMAFGRKQNDVIRRGIFMSAVITGAVTLALTAAFYALTDVIIQLLRVPAETVSDMKTYLVYVFIGFFATFLYNYVSNLLRSMGNSAVPLVFLGVSVVLNVGLDLLFVIPFHWGITGAALATVIAQYAAGIGIVIYFLRTCREYCPNRADMKWVRSDLRSILSLSGLTCLQQSVMNLGILMVQAVVNSFGSVVMAAFAVAVKIDTIAYMPVQDLGNAFSVFVAQNYGAGNYGRIRAGLKKMLVSTAVFCAAVSLIVCVFAEPLMSFFMDAGSAEAVAIGVEYLRTEGACYIGIGILFMMYGFYRAVNKPMMSVVLTVISLGTRVLLANVLSAVPEIGVFGIWIAVPIGWFLADTAGAVYFFVRERKKLMAVECIEQNGR